MQDYQNHIVKINNPPLSLITSGPIEKDKIQLWKGVINNYTLGTIKTKIGEL